MRTDQSGLECRRAGSALAVSMRQTRCSADAVIQSRRPCLREGHFVGGGIILRWAIIKVAWQYGSMPGVAKLSARVGPTVSGGFDSFCAFAMPNVQWQCSRGPRVEVLCPRTQCSRDRWRKVGCAVLGGADTGSGPPDRRNVARASGKHKHCLYCCLPYLTHASTSKTARAVKTGCRL